MNRNRPIPIVTLTLLIASSPSFAGEGFGGGPFSSKNVVTMVRVNPPEVFLPNPRVHVTGRSDRHSDLASRLQSLLESELVDNDKRISIDRTNPETRIELNVTQDNYDTSREYRKERELRKVGTNAKGKAVYDRVEVTVSYTIVSYTFEVTYKATDLRSGSSLTAGTSRMPQRKECREGKEVPTHDTLRDWAVRSAVHEIAAKLVPTREHVRALVPKGSFDKAAKLAEAGLWPKFLEAVQLIPEPKKPEDSAYRHYCLGLAFEALGYLSDDLETTLRYLENSSSEYTKALEVKPDEKFFREDYEGGGFLEKKTGGAASPLQRVKDALTKYQKLKDQREELIKGKSVGTPSVVASGGKDLDPQVITNRHVLEMLLQHVSEEVIRNAIDAAPRRHFDVSPAALVELSKAGASSSLLLYMQKAPPKRRSPKAKG